MELSSILRCGTLSRMIRARCFPDSLPLAKCHHLKRKPETIGKNKRPLFVRSSLCLLQVSCVSIWSGVRALTEGNKFYIYVLGNVGGGQFKTYKTP